MSKCRHCGKAFSPEEIEAKKKQKSDRIKAARAEARMLMSDKTYNKIYDREAIRKLRKDGLTIKAIAKQIGCSTSPVVAALKEETNHEP